MGLIFVRGCHEPFGGRAGFAAAIERFPADQVVDLAYGWTSATPSEDAPPAGQVYLTVAPDKYEEPEYFGPFAVRDVTAKAHEVSWGNPGRCTAAFVAVRLTIAELGDMVAAADRLDALLDEDDAARFAAAAVEIGGTAFRHPQTGFSPVHLAAEKDRADIIDRLRQAGLGMDEPAGTSRETPLAVALRSSAEGAARALIAAGASVRRTGISGSLLQQAAFWTPGAVEDMLAAGAGDIDAVGGFDVNTALHQAVHGGNVAATATLLAHGADPNVADRHGRTPLVTAVTRRDAEELTRLLLAHGADPGVVLNHAFHRRMLVESHNAAVKAMLGLGEPSLAAPVLSAPPPPAAGPAAGAPRARRLWSRLFSSGD